MDDIVLYSRRDCHLCRRAADWLETLGEQVATVMIDSDEGLAARYGTRVPVVVVAGREAVEGAFDLPTLARALAMARRADAPPARPGGATVTGRGESPGA